MAIGTMTLTRSDIKGPAFTEYLDEISFAGDSSYPTGGMTGVQAALQALTGDQRTILNVLATGANGGYDAQWIAATGKLMLFTVGGSAGSVKAELANTTNVSGTTFTLLVYSY